MIEQQSHHLHRMRFWLKMTILLVLSYGVTQTFADWVFHLDREPGNALHAVRWLGAILPAIACAIGAFSSALMATQHGWKASNQTALSRRMCVALVVAFGLAHVASRAVLYKLNTTGIDGSSNAIRDAGAIAYLGYVVQSTCLIWLGCALVQACAAVARPGGNWRSGRFTVVVVCLAGIGASWPGFFTIVDGFRDIARSVLNRYLIWNMDEAFSTSIIERSLHVVWYSLLMVAIVATLMQSSKRASPQTSAIESEPSFEVSDRSIARFRWLGIFAALYASGDALLHSCRASFNLEITGLVWGRTHDLFIDFAYGLQGVAGIGIGLTLIAFVRSAKEPITRIFTPAFRITVALVTAIFLFVRVIELIWAEPMRLNAQHWETSSLRALADEITDIYRALYFQTDSNIGMTLLGITLTVSMALLTLRLVSRWFNSVTGQQLRGRAIIALTIAFAVCWMASTIMSEWFTESFDFFAQNDPDQEAAWMLRFGLMDTVCALVSVLWAIAVIIMYRSGGTMLQRASNDCCLDCGYSYQGTAAPKCAECGNERSNVAANQQWSCGFNHSDLPREDPHFLSGLNSFRKALLLLAFIAAWQVVTIVIRDVFGSREPMIMNIVSTSARFVDVVGVISVSYFTRRLCTPSLSWSRSPDGKPMRIWQLPIIVLTAAYAMVWTQPDLLQRIESHSSYGPLIRGLPSWLRRFSADEFLIYAPFVIGGGLLILFISMMNAMAEQLRTHYEITIQNHTKIVRVVAMLSVPLMVVAAVVASARIEHMDRPELMDRVTAFYVLQIFILIVLIRWAIRYARFLSTLRDQVLSQIAAIETNSNTHTHNPDADPAT